MSSQCSVRVLNIKETRKTRGGAYIRGGLQPDIFFLFTGRWGYNRGGAAYKRQFTVKESEYRDKNRFKLFSVLFSCNEKKRLATLKFLPKSRT